MKIHTEIWNNCLEFIASNIDAQAFKTWFKPIQPIKFEHPVLTIQVPTQFFYEWLEDNYVQVLKAAIKAEIGLQGKLEYSVIVDKGGEANQVYTVNLAQKAGVSTFGRNKENQNHASNPFYIQEVAPCYQHSNLKPEYTFENYVEGGCNRLARSAGFRLAAKPGVTAFNPLMIHGGVGLGKTHLMHAIGNKIKQENDKHFVIYVAAETFTHQFLEALGRKGVPKFNNFYFNVDTLLIDDVQFFEGKPKTQEVFFQIFSHLHQHKKQIIMSSDRPVIELKGIQERLTSRFKWGLTAELETPEFKTRLEIITKKLQDDGVVIEDPVLEYLARANTNVRELEGVLISLIAHASLSRVDIDLALAEKTLKSIVKNIEKGVGAEYIAKQTSEYFNVSLEELKAKSRKKEVVIPRQTAMFLIKEHTNLTLKNIGAFFGNRDHSTVIHALRSVRNMLDTNTRFKTSFLELESRL